MKAQLGRPRGHHLLLCCALAALLIWVWWVVGGAEVVAFPDPNLEAVIREAIGKPCGDIQDSDLAALTRLEAVHRGIADLKGLEHCVNLQQLRIAGNELADISPLAGLTQLTELQLEHNPIIEIDALSELQRVRYIDLSGTLITDFSPLASLSQLTALSASFSQLTDVSSLSGLTRLSHLDLCVGKIRDISALAHLTGLTFLDLSDNDIVDISTLAGLTQLTELRLPRNRISDISALAGLSQLTRLTLQENHRIVDINPLAELSQLQYVHLAGNLIRSIAPLVRNAGIGRGDFVDVRMCELSLRLGSDSMQDIQALLARGASIKYEPQGEDTISTPLRVSGPAAGKTGKDLRFTASVATSNWGRSVEYRFDWGDGTYSQWSTSRTARHTYQTSGVYTVRAQAGDVDDPVPITSGWSRGHEVTIRSSVEIPLHYSVDSSLLLRVDITAGQLERFILSRGAVQCEGEFYHTADSPLASLGGAWITAGERTGINPVYLAAHAVVESCWGFGVIAQEKKNIYGYAAYNPDPYGEAWTFNSYEDCVASCSLWIYTNYLAPAGRFFSGEYGATLRGMGEHYAADEDWAEHVAEVMNQISQFASGE